VRVAVTPTGRVGIGTITPAANLHVVGNVYVSSNLTVDVSTLHVDATTNRVGILTKNPGFALDVHGTANVGTLVTTGLYGPIVGSNTATVSDLTASGTVSGATLTGTNVYGTLVGSNTAAVSDLTASGTVSGTTLTGTNVYGTLEGSNTASVSTLTVNDTTASTSTGTGALVVTGGVGIGGNVHASNIYSTGGLITNTDGVTKKTYSDKGTFSGSTLAITFSSHTFSAKITGHLIDTSSISTLIYDCTGGKGSPIVNGPISIFGGEPAWSTSVTTDATTVTLTGVDTLAYHIFIEYISGDPTGSVTTIGGTSTGY
jgi:hypothetical protein